MYKLGIIGNGFVGSSVAFGFSPQTGCDGVELKIYDKQAGKSTHTIAEVVNDSDYIFLSVPTPMKKDGSVSLDIVYGLTRCISDNKHCKAEEFELGSGVNYSINEIANMFGYDYPKKYLPKRSGEYDMTLCTDDKANRLLNWKSNGDIKNYIKKWIEERI